MQNYINNYNNSIYKDYLEKLQYLYSYKLKILKKGEDDNRYFKEDSNSVELKYNNMHLLLTKPKYKNIFNEIEALKKEKSELIIEYNNLQYNIIHNLHKEADYKKYQEIINKLKDLDNKVKDYLEYYIKINQSNKNDRIDNFKNRDDIKKKKIELFDNIIKEPDSILHKKYIMDYFEFVNQYYDTYNKYKKDIDFIITDLPKIEEKNIIKKSEAKKEIKKKPKLKKTDEEIEKEKKSKLKKKIQEKLQNTPTAKLDKMEDSIKDQLNKLFKFSNEAECASRAHSAKFFMKKGDILQIIKKSEEIKKRLPDNYESLSKQDICKELYKL